MSDDIITINSENAENWSIPQHSMLSVELQIYKFSIERFIRSKWKNDNLMPFSSDDEFFDRINQNLLVSVIVCSLYQYKDKPVISNGNKIWAKRLITMGIPKESKYAVDVPPKALDTFASRIRKLYSW